MEVWKDIPGFDLYEVSDYGRVRNKRSGKFLKLQESNKGYVRVYLSQKPHSVHRLVANAFIENSENKPCVNHIDNNKKNNKVENLEWVTFKENMQWASIQGRMTPDENVRKKLSNAHRDKRSVVGIDKNGKEHHFESLTDVKELGYIPNKVSMCCRGMRKTAYGLVWRFE